MGSSQSVSTDNFAPGTRIAYDPQLIERFEGHHASLLKTFGLIHKAAEERNYTSVQTALGRFRRLLQEHLLEENLRLYVYLNKCLANDSGSNQIVLSMKDEMNQIGRTVMTFLNHYESTGINETNIAGFVIELGQVGAALTDRIEREERSLYTLYLHPESY